MGFVRGIQGAIGAAANAAANMAKAAVSAAKRFLHIGSPSKVMKDKIGRWIPAGLAVGMQHNLGMVAKASDQMAQAAMVTVPSPNMDKFNAGTTALKANATLTNSGVIEHEIKMTSQPAQINLTLGGTSYVAFVDDISKQQDINISLQRKRM